MKWQEVAIILITVAGAAGFVSYVSLFGALFELTGMDYSYTGDINCINTCESYINVTTSYWRICFEHSTPDQTAYIQGKSRLEKTTIAEHPETILFKKSVYGRTLWVNLNNVDNIISTNPRVEVDWLVPTYGKRWRPLRDGDCWERGKVNKIKIVGHKSPVQTVKWSFILDEEKMNIDPLWVGNKHYIAASYQPPINYTVTYSNNAFHVHTIEGDIDLGYVDKGTEVSLETQVGTKDRIKIDGKKYILNSPKSIKEIAKFKIETELNVNIDGCIIDYKGVYIDLCNENRTNNIIKKGGYMISDIHSAVYAAGICSIDGSMTLAQVDTDIGNEFYSSGNDYFADCHVQINASGTLTIGDGETLQINNNHADIYGNLKITKGFLIMNTSSGTFYDVNIYNGGTLNLTGTVLPEEIPSGATVWDAGIILETGLTYNKHWGLDCDSGGNLYVYDSIVTGYDAYYVDANCDVIGTRSEWGWLTYYSHGFMIGSGDYFHYNYMEDYYNNGGTNDEGAIGGPTPPADMNVSHIFFNNTGASNAYVLGGYYLDNWNVYDSNITSFTVMSRSTGADKWDVTFWNCSFIGTGAASGLYDLEDRNIVYNYGGGSYHPDTAVRAMFPVNIFANEGGVGTSATLEIFRKRTDCWEANDTDWISYANYTLGADGKTQDVVWLPFNHLVFTNETCNYLYNYTINKSTDYNSTVVNFSYDTQTYKVPTVQKDLGLPGEASSDLSIAFVEPTPLNNSIQSQLWAEINISVNATNLTSWLYEWDGTNYTLFDADIIAFYNFNNISALGETTTKVVDLSLAGNDLEIVGTMYFNDTNCHSMNCYDLNLTGYFKDDTPTFQLTNQSNNTLSFWMYEKGENANIAGLIGFGENPEFSIYLENDEDFWLQYNNNALVQSWLLLGNPGFELTGSLTHVALVKNMETISFYINSQLITTTVIDLSPTVQQRFRTQMPWGDMRLFNGTMDDLIIFNRTLSQVEISLLYNMKLDEYDLGKYFFSVNQSKDFNESLDNGVYIYDTYASDVYNNDISPDERTLTIGISTYYVNYSGGSDGNTGNTITSPLKTIASINSKSLSAGDTVLFARGETWNETLNISDSGNSTHYITIGSYGNGINPIIQPVHTTSGWTVYSGNIYKATTTANVTMVYVNNVFHNKSHEPDGYFFNATSGNKYHLVDATPNFANDSLINATIIVNTVAWELEDEIVTDYDNGTNNISWNGEFIWSVDNSESYYLENKFFMLDSPGEWYYNESDNTIYLWAYDSSNPDTKIVTFSNYTFGILSENQQYIKIENLTVQKGGKANVYFNNVNNSIIRNITSLYAGGYAYDEEGIQSYKINFTGSVVVRDSDNVLIEHNDISDSRINGIVLISTTNSEIYNNTINNTGTIGVSVKSEAAIALVARDLTTAFDSNSIIKHNFIYNTGYLGIRIGMDDLTIDQNYIEEICNILIDCGGIYNYGRDNTSIKNNIIIGGYGNNGSNKIAKVTDYIEGIYMDELSNRSYIYNNTVINTSDGIKIHSGDFAYLKDNHIYAVSHYPMDILSHFSYTLIHYINITGNYFYTTSPSSYTNSIWSYYGDFYWLNTNHNYYATPYYDYDFDVNNSFYTLKSWQDDTVGNDTDSVSIIDYYDINLTEGNDVSDDFLILYNANYSNRTFTLDNNYTDIYSALVSGSVTVDPWESVILYAGYCNNDGDCNNNETTVSCPSDCVAVDSCTTNTINCTENCTVTDLDAGGDTIYVTGTGAIYITGAITNCNSALPIRNMGNGCNIILRNGGSLC